ncbi:MAG TPA: hypothetical protein VNI34_05350 [Candidatus Nitrosotalea sp.]|nr:hypothetical protein [Candidatus Nitrosotalea sp.]
MTVNLVRPLPVRADQTIGGLQQQIQQDQTLLNTISSQLAANTSSIASLQNQISQTRAVLAKLDAQLASTQAQLATDRGQLDQLVARENQEKADLAANEQKLAAQEALFDSHVRTLDKVERMPIFEILLTSRNFSDFLGRVMIVKEIVNSDYQLATELKATRAQIKAEVALLDSQRVQQAGIVAQVTSQDQLLSAEQSQQSLALRNIASAQYQLQADDAALANQQSSVNSQLAADQAQLRQMEQFTQGRVGSGGAVLSPEYDSDSWGTYYNQRDARWGNDYMGASPYQVWEIGCLITDVAMVYTHFGEGWVNPGTIALNTANFTSGGLMYNSVLDIPGHAPSINWSPTSAWIDSYLATGGTVIVGMYIGGGTHFVTLTGMRGAYDYWMNDPWNPYAMQVSFDQSNVTGPIFEAVGYH